MHEANSFLSFLNHKGQLHRKPEVTVLEINTGAWYTVDEHHTLTHLFFPLGHVKHLIYKDQKVRIFFYRFTYSCLLPLLKVTITSLKLDDFFNPRVSALITSICASWAALLTHDTKTLKIRPGQQEVFYPQEQFPTTTVHPF